MPFFREAKQAADELAHETITYNIRPARRHGVWGFHPVLNDREALGVFCEDEVSARSTAYAIAATCKQQREAMGYTTDIVIGGRGLMRVS
jgi:hypothetical protein